MKVGVIHLAAPRESVPAGSTGRNLQ